MKLSRGLVKEFANSAENSSRTFRILAIGLFLLGLISCGGAGSPDAGNSPAAKQNSTASQSSTQGTGSGSNGMGKAPLPGTEEFGLSKQELVKSIEAVESEIARCMSRAGFEYTAVDYNTVRKGMTADKSLPGVSDREYIAQYGYGISTLYSGLAPQLTQLVTPAQIGLGKQNVQIFNKLSPADQVAYNHTLFGANTDATFAVSLEIEDLSRTGGCTRSAIEKVFTVEQLETTFRNPLDARIEEDPRMIAALGKFTECLRDKGFNYNRPGDIEPDIQKRLYAITEGALLESLSAESQAALKELQGEERAIAAIETKCTTELLEPVEAEILRELYAGQVQ